MASMIEEADDVSQPLLDVILECVTSPKIEEQPQAYRSHPTCSACCIKMCFALYACAMMGCTLSPRAAALIHFVVLYHAMLCCPVLYPAMLC